MVDQFNRSFIPKKASEDGDMVRTKGVGLLMVAAVVLLFVTVIGSVGVFSYNKVLESSIERKKVSLEEAREVFEPGLIRELKRLDNRLDISEQIINNHTAVSNVFSVLENLTLRNLQFKTFSYVINAEGHEIKMSGVAKSFGTVALQSDAFGESDSIRNPIFSNLTVDADGNVAFDFVGTVISEVLSYEPRLSEQLESDSIFEESTFEQTPEEPLSGSGSGAGGSNGQGESPVGESEENDNLQQNP